MMGWESTSNDHVHQYKTASNTIYISRFGTHWYVSCWGVVDDKRLYNTDTLEEAQEEALEIIWDMCHKQALNAEKVFDEMTDLMVELISDKQ